MARPAWRESCRHRRRIAAAPPLEGGRALLRMDKRCRPYVARIPTIAPKARWPERFPRAAASRPSATPTEASSALAARVLYRALRCAASAVAPCDTRDKRRCGARGRCADVCGGAPTVMCPAPSPAGAIPTAANGIASLHVPREMKFINLNATWTNHWRVQFQKSGPD